MLLNILLLYKISHFSSSPNKISSVPCKSTIISLRSLWLAPAPQFQRMTICFKFLWWDQPTSGTKFCNIYYCKNIPKLSSLKEIFIVISHGFIGWLVNCHWIVNKVKTSWKLGLELSEGSAELRWLILLVSGSNYCQEAHLHWLPEQLPVVSPRSFHRLLTAHRLVF